MSHEEADGMLRVLLESQGKNIPDPDPWPLYDSNLGVRIVNIIEKQLGISTFGRLSQVTERELLACRGFSWLSLFVVRDAMANRGLCLAKEDTAS